jgi:hypothetical protein
VNRINNATDAVLLMDTMQNVVSGNVFNSLPGNQYRFAIGTVNTGFSRPDVWGPNSFVGAFGLGSMQPIRGMTQLVPTITA